MVGHLFLLDFSIKIARDLPEVARIIEGESLDLALSYTDRVRRAKTYSDTPQSPIFDEVIKPEEFDVYVGNGNFMMPLGLNPRRGIFKDEMRSLIRERVVGVARIERGVPFGEELITRLMINDSTEIGEKGGLTVSKYNLTPAIERIAGLINSAAIGPNENRPYDFDNKPRTSHLH